MIDMTGIDELPSKRFRLRKQVAGQTIKGTFATAKAAADARDRAITSLAAGNYELVDGESIRSLGPRFLGSRNRNRASKTDTSRWEHIKVAPFASKPCVLVTRREVLEWIESLREVESKNRNGGTLSRASRKHCRNLLSAFFEWAIERELAPSNPCIGVVVKREDGDEEEGWQDSWYLDVKEQRELLAAIPAGVDRRFIACAMGAGLRLGEICCLHLEDVFAGAKESNPRIEVKYGSWDPGKRRYRPTKGRTGEKKTRTVHLFGMALEAVREQLANLPEKNQYKLLWPSRWGGRRTKGPKSFLTLPVHPRIGRRPWMHLMRHTCASSLVAGWWGHRRALEDVCKFLGHSSVEVTERYAHLIPAVLAERATEAQAAWLSGGNRVVTRLVTARSSPIANRLKKPGRATKDSNFRPSASEDDEFRKAMPGNARRDDRMTAIGAIEGALEAVRDRSPFALRRCVDALGVARDVIAASSPAKGKVSALTSVVGVLRAVADGCEHTSLCGARSTRA